MTDAVQTILERRSAEPSRRQRTAAGLVALALHALAVTAAFAVPRLTAGEREYPEYVAVQVLPSAPLPAPRPRPAPPPEPEPAPEPEPEPEPQPPPEPEPEPDVPALPAEEPAPAPEPEPEPRPAPPAPRPAPPPEPAPPSPSPGGGAADGGPGLDAQVMGPEGAAFPYDYYLDQMLRKIRQGWVRPPVDDIETLLGFRVRRNGEITGVEIRESSGSRAFDLAALRAVRNASPLPPLPTSYREGELTVNLIVR